MKEETPKPQDHEAHNNNKEVNHEPESMPQKSGGSKVWMIIAVIAIILLIGLGIYGYMKVKNLNNQISSQQAQINDLTNKKQTLEDAAAAAAKSTVNTVINQSYSIPDLGIQIKLDDNLKGILYAYDQQDKLGIFSTRDGSYKMQIANGVNPPYNIETGLIGIASVSDSPNVPGCVGSCPTVMTKLSNGKYVLYTSPQNIGTNDKTVQSLVSSQIDSFKNALKNAKPL